jgi:hypothetical protein
MEQARISLTIRAQRQGLVEITRKIAAWLAEQTVSDGLLTVFIAWRRASALTSGSAAWISSMRSFSSPELSAASRTADKERVVGMD